MSDRLRFPIMLFSLITLCFLLIFAHTRGFVPHDEGWFLNAGLRFYNGQLPYKDFEYLYNPGSIYLNFLAFKLFGISILSSRIIAVINSLLAIILLFFLGKTIRLTKFQTVAMAFLYAVWGPMHINFVWPVMFCLTGAFAAMLLFAKLQNTSAPRPLLIFLIGVVTSLIFILKQNFGAAAFAASLLAILFQKDLRTPKTLLFFGLGLSTPIILQLLFFLPTRTLVAYIDELKFTTFTKIIGQGALSSPFPWQYPAPLIYKFIKTILYLLPAIISVALLFKLKKLKQTRLLAIPLFTLFFYALSIRPTTDQVHLFPLLALSAPAIFLLFKNKIFLLPVLALITLSAYLALFNNYYRWDTPLANQSHFSKNPRALISFDTKGNQSVAKISAYFSAHYSSQNQLFVYSFAPMFNFLLNKTNPTAYDYVHPDVLTPQRELTIVKTLQKNNLPLILTNINLAQNSSTISSFIQKNYHPVKFINDYTIWQKNDVLKPAPASKAQP